MVAPLFHLGLMAAIMAVATFTGWRLAKFMPWSHAAREARVNVAFGFALAPFILGLAAVLTLAALAGASHLTHLIAVAALTAAPALLRGPAPAVPASKLAWTSSERLLATLVVAWGGLLLFNSLFLPLTQNDSLEYALTGRLLFETRTLSVYPALNPALGSSGFYGPWTHPPLYPALIYLANILQGHAETPGIMRLIAPWCALCATGLVFSIGRMVDRRTGLLAALFLLSTPLLFLGADSALIDAMPVLGFALVFTTLVSTEGSPMPTGIALGAALGLALWTHSQAILFIPLALAALVLRREWRRDRRTLWEWAIQGATAVAVALLVAAWPYARNISLFGSPVSDNPLVFRLPGLAWPDYFSLARGIASWPEKIQYGLLKGWFAPEAYGFVFWIGAVGVIVYLRQLRRREAPAASPLRVGLILLIIYLLGVVVSMILGIDLMIRNERYWLVILPLVALFAALPFEALLKTQRRLVVLGVLLSITLGQAAVLSFYRLHANGYFDSVQGEPAEALLRHRPNLDIIRFLNTRQDDGLVLALKPADMFYSRKRMLSYLDPRLESVYGEASPVKAARMLRDLGVREVQATDYGLPPLYNSALQEILADPALSSLLYSSDGNQIYSLEPERAQPAANETVDFTPGKTPWTKQRHFLIGGRKALARWTGTLRAYPSPTAESAPSLPLFQRDWSTLLMTGNESAPNDPSLDGLPVQGGAQYRVNLQLAGRAYVQIWIQQFNREGSILRDSLARSAQTVLIGDLAVNRVDPPASFVRRFVTRPDARWLRVGVEYRGAADVSVVRATLTGFHLGD